MIFIIEVMSIEEDMGVWVNMKEKEEAVRYGVVGFMEFIEKR